jgi:hypothetical protein
MNQPRKIGTILTALDPSLPIPTDVQLRAASNYALTSSRVFTAGTTIPPVADGVRHFPDGGKMNIRTLFSRYATCFLGRDTVAITNPDIEFDLSSVEIQKELEARRIQMTWGFAATDIDDGIPVAFVFSSSVVPAIINQIPASAAFNWDWQSWFGDYLKRYLGHRYFTVNGICEKIVLEKKSAPVEPLIKKKAKK